jgi:hypothetical protein
MSESQLNALEREVESARARVAGDLARLRSPSTLMEFKDEFWVEARHAKDQLAEKSSDYVTGMGQRLLDDVKGRVAANPAAALAIGAGLAWQMLRRPPITSLLIGAGVFGLMKARPDANGDIAAGIARQAHDVSNSVTERVQSWAAEAAHVAQDAAAKVVENVSPLADRVSEALSGAGQTARDSVTQAATDPSFLRRPVAANIPDGVADKDVRDQILLGAAALAIATAIGIASQRRSQQGP